ARSLDARADRRGDQDRTGRDAAVRRGDVRRPRRELRDPLPRPPRRRARPGRSRDRALRARRRGVRRGAVRLRRPADRDPADGDEDVRNPERTVVLLFALATVSGLALLVVYW